MRVAKALIGGLTLRSTSWERLQELDEFEGRTTRTDASTNPHWQIHVLNQNGVQVLLSEIRTQNLAATVTVPEQSQSDWTVEATNLMDQSETFLSRCAPAGLHNFFGIVPGGLVRRPNS